MTTLHVDDPHGLLDRVAIYVDAAEAVVFGVRRSRAGAAATVDTSRTDALVLIADAGTAEVAFSGLPFDDGGESVMMVDQGRTEVIVTLLPAGAWEAGAVVWERD